jgi:predicted N-formylglutamate amidohydrolase
MTQLLAPDEPPAFEPYNDEGRAPVLLVCDHASARMPRRLGNLGLDAEARARHIAWDIGAAEVARRLARALDAPLLLAGYSRLVIDLNRHLKDPSSIPQESDEVPVPGNRGLLPAERDARAAALFHPYHDAVAAALERLGMRGKPPALISVHSFTPHMAGKARPWHIGVLWDRDDRIAKPLMQALAAEAGIMVGDNEPYTGRDATGYTVEVHAGLRGWPHLSLELRQDLIGEASGAEEWSRRLAKALSPILAHEALYRAL